MKNAKPMPPTKKITTKGNNVTKKDIQPSVKTGQKAGSNKASEVETNGELPYKNPVLKPSVEIWASQISEFNINLES